MIIFWQIGALVHGTGVGLGFGTRQVLLSLLTFQYWAIFSQEDIMVPFGRRQSSVRLLSHVPKTDEKKFYQNKSHQQFTLSTRFTLSLCLLYNYHYYNKFLIPLIHSYWSLALSKSYYRILTCSINLTSVSLQLDDYYTWILNSFEYF